MVGLFFLSGLLLSLPLEELERIDVFVPQKDGFQSIRIPSLVVTNQKTLLAFAEGRARDADQATNKLLLKRSTDAGKTWSRLAVIADQGNQSLNNPCALVDRRTGRIFLMFQSYPEGLAERSNKIETGHEGDRIVRNHLITSDDDGITWSTPRDVTRETKRPTKVTTMASGPGIGIQLRHGNHAGRLIFPINEGPYGLWNIYTVFSDDQGKSWRMGEIVPGGFADNTTGKTSMVNEAQIVELADGSIRFNARRWAGKPYRKTSVSKDGGITWSPVEDVAEQLDPSCMGSIFRLTDATDHDRSRILFSGPQSKKRDNGTVFLSYDEGKTWPVQRVICSGSFAYSCLGLLPDGTLGCLYEADDMKRIVLARFTLEWLTRGNDPWKNKH